MISPDFLFSNITKKQSDYFLSIIRTIGREKHIEKGRIIIQQGAAPTFFFYILEGVFKTTTLRNDKPYILGFTFKDDIDCCPASLLKGIPNNFNIEAVTDCKVLICNITDFKKACSPENYAHITNNIMTNYVRLLENRVIETLSLTAEERYKVLASKQPQQIEKIPLQQIAAYLGITQERLSRIRKKLAL